MDEVTGEYNGCCVTYFYFHIRIIRKFRQLFKIAIITSSDGFKQITINFPNQVSSQ